MKTIIKVHGRILMTFVISFIAFCASAVSAYCNTDSRTYPVIDILLDTELQLYTQDIAHSYGISYPLALAVMEQESSFRTNVVSCGNYGLFQINTINLKHLSSTIGVTDLTDPQQNIKGGCFLLKELFDKYGTESKVLMAYNCGEAGAKRCWNKNVFETDFSKSVLNRKAKYEALLITSNNVNISERKEVASMSFYHTCPYCGSNLDPAERCDCDNNDKQKHSSDEGGDNIGDYEIEQLFYDDTRTKRKAKTIKTSKV